MMYYYLALAAVLFTGAGQIFLKIGSKKGGTVEIYLNPATLAGYGMFLMATVCTIYALRVMDLKTLYAIMSLNPLVVMTLSVFVLKETLTKDKVIAVWLVFCGLFIFNL